MRGSAALHCLYISLALFQAVAVGAGIVGSALDQEADFYNEEDPYEEEPLTEKRSIREDILDDGSRFTRRRPELVNRQQAAPGAAGAGAVPVAVPQPQNVTQTTNNTNNATSGSSPGYVGNSNGLASNLVNCSDVTSGRSNTCWAQLNLTGYVKDWTNSNVCYPGEGFSTCFLRKNGFPGLDCSGISVSSCVAPQSDAVNSDAKKFYVAYNIYAVNAFFYSWWTAVGNSGGIAQDNLAKIVQTIDVPSNTPVAIQDVLIALQSVFAIIPGPLAIWAAHNAFSFAFQQSAQVVSNALGVLPNIGRFLFPTETAASQLVQIGELGSNLATVLMQVQSNLNQTLVSVMANSTEFLAFAEQGNFSSKPQSLPDQANYLYFAFNTYLISQALNGNNVYAVIGRGTDPQQLRTNGTKLNYEIDCKTYNAQNVCDAWWYSKNFESAFTLDDFSHMNRNFNKELTTLLTNLTTGELLFEGAYSCNSQGNFGQPINITVNAGGVNTACISQLKVLTWDMTCHAEPSGSSSNPHQAMIASASGCEFLEGNKQNTFFYDNVHSVSGSPIYSVPYGYLGPALTSSRYRLQRT